jgi:DNA processing protein
LIEERAYWLAWSQIQGVGAILLKRLYGHFGDLGTAWDAAERSLQGVEGIGEKLGKAIAEQRREIDPAALLAAQTGKAAQFITPVEASYPPLLFEIPDPPPVLYYQGNLDLLSACQQRPAVGIVGTRSPSEYGRRWTRRLTMALSRAGFLIVSGLADGVDREAHQACLEQRGNTLAVLGTGVDVVYPYGNRSLHQAIATKGLLLSEHPPGTQPDRVHFPRRNRIIAGLSRAILVTEAPHQSGALITARLGNDYGRDVYVLPASLDNPRGRGCLELIDQGAHLILSEDTLLDALGGIPLEPESTAKTVPPPVDLAPHLQQVYQVVCPEATPLDAIVEQSAELGTGDVLSALVQLELMGLVMQLPGMQYQRCP